MCRKLTKLMNALRVDISALLLIAFVFQFVTPVVVLASESPAMAEFESAMRTSICRVNLDNDPDTPSHTDSFVCDYCVLCHQDATRDFDLILPEVAHFDFHIGPPNSAKQSHSGTKHFRITPARNRHAPLRKYKVFALP